MSDETTTDETTTELHHEASDAVQTTTHDVAHEATHEATHAGAHEATHAGAFAHSDTVSVPFIGDVTVPGGIYTVVFAYLGILTVLEVLIAELIDAPEGSLIATLKIVGLVATSLGKAVLVILFYMHLRWDNRILWVVLIMPTLVVLIAVLYLLSVPTGAGMGYLP